VEDRRPPQTAADGPGAQAGGDTARAAPEQDPTRKKGQSSRHETPPDRERAGERDERILLLSSDQPGLPTDETNLVVRAAQAFADAIAASGAGDVAKGAAGHQRSTVGRGQAGAASSGSSSVLPHSAGSLDGRAAAGEDLDAAANRDSSAGLAARVVGGEATARVRPVSARLEKQIPLGAGLGGGSSDAARTLIALNRLWGLNWPGEKLAPLAAALGSDVPFFLFGPSSICTGRGEVVRPVSQPRVARWCVLMLPEIHMPTAAVYKRFDELGLDFDDEIEHEPDWINWSAKKSKDLLSGLVNDLERPAFEIKPELGKLRADVELRLGRTVRMSGSGSSLFTLFDEASDARQAAESVEKNFGVRAKSVQLAPELRDDVGSM